MVRTAGGGPAAGRVDHRRSDPPGRQPGRDQRRDRCATREAAGVPRAPAGERRPCRSGGPLPTGRDPHAHGTVDAARHWADRPVRAPAEAAGAEGGGVAEGRPARVPELSYFFPAHNEEANLQGLVAEALETLPSLAERFEIVIVDDGSRDATPPLADGLA